MINYFRTDGWVKTSQGPAVPGAQIFVCLQPANVGFPPTPLANIFSDVNGLVPITQPSMTDGFGHYDFYAQAGLYTVLVGLGGTIQQVYPDQSVGAFSNGGGTALVLQVNGAPASSQLLFNLVGQNSVSVVDAGSGTVNIVGSVFQTNGVPNTLQSVLNLKAGTSITLASDGVGGVTINSAVTGLILPWFIGPGVTTNAAATSSASVQYLTVNNAVLVFEFCLVGSVTVSNVSISVTNGAGGRVVAFGIYSLAGNLLLDSGAMSAASAVMVSSAITPVVLPAGNYYFAQTANTGAVTVQGLTAQAQPFLDMMNVSATRAAVATNTYNGTSLPATLGALTALTVANYAGIAYPLFS